MKTKAYSIGLKDCKWYVVCQNRIVSRGEENPIDAIATLSYMIERGIDNVLGNGTIYKAKQERIEKGSEEIYFA